MAVFVFPMNPVYSCCLFFQVVDSLKVGNDALKEVNKLLSIEDIERILDETQEAADKQEVGSSVGLFK